MCCKTVRYALRLDHKVNGLIKTKEAKMLKCNNCAARVDVLAHQIRESIEVTVCLDCADRYYQDQLTKSLIANEKVGA
jgi:hypothetical protein